LEPKWYETFFQGIALDFWRQAVSPQQTRAEADFLERELASAPGRDLLDVPCGNGRHALELSRRGHRLTGLDISREFVEEARQAAAQEGLPAQFRLGDMRELPRQLEFDAAYCFGNSFGYLDRDAARAFLDGLHAVLRPFGRLAIETGTAAESLLPSIAARRWHRASDIVMLSESRYHAEHSRLDVDYTFLRGQSSETRATCSYVMTVAEIRCLLASSGFATAGLYSSVAGEPFQLGSPRLILVAVRS
jgi:SAM-dependent methyltransferase